ncbi:MAG: heme exporter protein CcmD [Coxiellaceae bacterium]|nr:heme exporter protein CcmD [Coxiellaceae bacterium]
MIMFHGLESFVRLGGYGKFVWPSFAVGFAALFTNFMVVRAHLHRVRKHQDKSELDVVHENTM